MTAPKPEVTARRVEINETVAKHPLATHAGISLFGHLVEADRAWTRLTKRQREILCDLCPPLLSILIDNGSLPAEALPKLPDGTRSSTRGSLESAGMVDPATGRLTGRALHAWYWKIHWPSRECAS